MVIISDEFSRSTGEFSLHICYSYQLTCTLYTRFSGVRRTFFSSLFRLCEMSAIIMPDLYWSSWKFWTAVGKILPFGVVWVWNRNAHYNSKSKMMHVSPLSHPPPHSLFEYASMCVRDRTRGRSFNVFCMSFVLQIEGHQETLATRIQMAKTTNFALTMKCSINMQNSQSFHPLIQSIHIGDAVAAKMSPTERFLSLFSLLSPVYFLI